MWRRDKIFKRSRVTVFVLALFWLSRLAASTAFAAEVEAYADLDRFVWKEFSDNGALLLTESGALTGVGAVCRAELPGDKILDASAGIFGGAVRYEGVTQSGVPTTSTVDYLGVKAGADAGKRYFPAEPFTLEPFAGLGVRAWVRRIRNGATTAGPPEQVRGYTEQWTTVHARLGARGGMDISQTRSLFAEAGMRLPLYNENIAYLSREGIGPDVKMHPGWEWSYFAEAGMKIDRITASLFYDGLRFSRSAVVLAAGGHFYYQPKSTADSYGLKVGFVF
jgi:hypothetical protein